MVALDFNSAICHSVNGLIDYNGGVRLSHDFVDLVALGADEEGDHALGDEDDDGEGFAPDFLEDLVDVIEKAATALVLFVHVSVVDLY